MFEIIQEASLPKLSTTSLYVRFNASSNITTNIINTMKHISETTIMPNKIEDIIALMKLNGDATIKKAIASYLNGRIIISFNPDSSKIPAVLPFLITKNKNGTFVAYIFAEKVVDDITSSNEYRKLMAVLEAAYLALKLQEKPKAFTMNRQLMLTLCNIYTLMVIAPLEQKLYIKGDNLTKIMLYVIAYFYRMIDGDNLSGDNIPYRQFMLDKVDKSIIDQTIDDVKAMPDLSFSNLLNLISKINSVRYKDLPVMYQNYFVQTCGVSLLFALENIAYLMTLVTSAEYKTPITMYGINKASSLYVKKAIKIIASLNIY